MQVHIFNYSIFNFININYFYHCKHGFIPIYINVQSCFMGQLPLNHNQYKSNSITYLLRVQGSYQEVTDTYVPNQLCTYMASYLLDISQSLNKVYYHCIPTYKYIHYVAWLLSYLSIFNKVWSQKLVPETNIAYFKLETYAGNKITFLLPMCVA